MEFLNPKNWRRPKGYSNAVAARGKSIYLAGLVGWNAEEKFETDSFAGQTRQVFDNIVTVLAEAGARPEHIVRMTWYVTDKDEYLASLAEVGAAYREVIGRHYPAMALVQVAGLVEAGAKLEIETTAIIPDDE